MIRRFLVSDEPEEFEAVSVLLAQDSEGDPEVGAQLIFD